MASPDPASGDTPAFARAARAALEDPQLQTALQNVRRGFVVKRASAKAKLPEFEDLREQARKLKDHTLAHLDLYLEAYETKVRESGGEVHWAATAEDARATVLSLCRLADARTVTKGKSMVSEEIGLNHHLEAAGLRVVETDLGEYLIQLRGERPSHIIAPAIHLTRTEIEADFRRAHHDLPTDRRLDRATDLVGEARTRLRADFIAADVGITGANLLVAETGSSIIVTNEGNGDLTQILARMHIVIASIEKVVPTIEDALTVLRLLARSATGQEISTYTTFSTGPRRDGDPDGPGAYHVVLVDNGRTAMLAGELRDMLRCIRCGACLNHCPVYAAVGGHAYGSVYPGPMGAVLTPALEGAGRAADLPHASTFCGRCEEVCPMKIPLTRMMRLWRERSFDSGDGSWIARVGLRAWAFAARRPRLYHALTGLLMPMLARLGGAAGRLHWLPLVGGWTRHRDLPAPEGRTFHQLWADQRKGARSAWR